jgi:hypothetical protein
MTAPSQDLTCYCFGYTAADIRQDVTEHGYSRILEKIRAAKKQGNCQCVTKNPTGR